MANAAKCGIAHVTPWLWLGGGNYRTVSATSTGIRDDFTWDYNLACAAPFLFCAELAQILHETSYVCCAQVLVDARA